VSFVARDPKETFNAAHSAHARLVVDFLTRSRKRVDASWRNAR
jgi:hypothetical protein